MKTQQVLAAVAVGFVMALMAASAQASGWENMGNVYRNGVSIGSMYDVKMQEPGMTSEQAIAEIKKFYAEQAIQRKKDRDQEQRAKKREAYIERQIAVGQIMAYLPENVTPIVEDAINGFLATYPQEFQDKWTPILASIQTIDDVRGFFNSAYGTNYTNTDIQELINYGKTLSPAEEAAYIAGATTCAIKLIEGNGPCGAGTGTGA